MLLNPTVDARRCSFPNRAMRMMPTVCVGFNRLSRKLNSQRWFAPTTSAAIRMTPSTICGGGRHSQRQIRDYCEIGLLSQPAA